MHIKIINLLETLGALRNLNIHRDNGSCDGFFEYRDNSLSQAAIDGFNELELGSHTLLVKLDPNTNTNNINSIRSQNENRSRSRSRSRDRERKQE